jgi:hypothetical protein
MSGSPAGRPVWRRPSDPRRRRQPTLPFRGFRRSVPEKASGNTFFTISIARPWFFPGVLGVQIAALRHLVGGGEGRRIPGRGGARVAEAELDLEHGGRHAVAVFVHVFGAQLEQAVPQRAAHRRAFGPDHVTVRRDVGVGERQGRLERSLAGLRLLLGEQAQLAPAAQRQLARPGLRFGLLDDHLGPLVGGRPACRRGCVRWASGQADSALHRVSAAWAAARGSPPPSGREPAISSVSSRAVAFSLAGGAHGLAAAGEGQLEDHVVRGAARLHAFGPEGHSRSELVARELVVFAIEGELVSAFGRVVEVDGVARAR